MKFTAKEIAAYVGGTVDGDEEISVSTFAKIEEATQGSLTFLANPKYISHIYTTGASIVLVNNDFTPEHPVKPTLVRCANAYESLAKLMTLHASMEKRQAVVSSLAYVSGSATIGQNVTIEPFAFIGDYVTIDDDTIIHAHVCIYPGCRIGKRCILHSGCVIGADGFGFAPQAEGYEKIPQIGIVVIDDDVEVGANTCIDRATMGETRISQGVKLDNLVQIAHNVVVGQNTVMAGQSGIAGSAKVGEWCMIGGQAGISGHINMGNRVQVGAQSGITGNVRDDKVLFGYPAIEHRKYARCNAVFRNLPDMAQELSELKKEVDKLKQQLAENANQ